jgi:predicted DNA binding CopG/RHH family protein
VLFATVYILYTRYYNPYKNINIRIPEFDMLMLKRRSTELNIPYQTILSSLIHQYVTKKEKLLA